MRPWRLQLAGHFLFNGLDFGTKQKYPGSAQNNSWSIYLLPLSERFTSLLLSCQKPNQFTDKDELRNSHRYHWICLNTQLSSFLYFELQPQFHNLYLSLFQVFHIAVAISTVIMTRQAIFHRNCLALEDWRPYEMCFLTGIGCFVFCSRIYQRTAEIPSCVLSCLTAWLKISWQREKNQTTADIA